MSGLWFLVSWEVGDGEFGGWKFGFEEVGKSESRYFLTLANLLLVTCYLF